MRAMPRAHDLPRVAEIVRRHDPDRFFSTLFAPQPGRETLWTLYAFNHELARAREAVREPFAALIRLQWWREVVEGARRRHEVAEPLAAALAEGRLAADDLVGMIDAREAETEPMETLEAFAAYLRGSAGGVMVAAGRALGEAEPERLRRAGAAYGAAGVLRSVPALSRQGRCMLPEDVLREAGSSGAAVVAKGGVLPAGVEARVLGLVGEWLEPRLLVSRAVLPALLPAALARRAVRRGRSDAGGGRVAMLAGAVTGRV